LVVKEQAGCTGRSTSGAALADFAPGNSLDGSLMISRRTEGTL